MINELKKKVGNLQEDEVKSFLFHILLRFNMLDGKEHSVKEFIEHVEKTYEFITLRNNQNEMEKDYEKVHIVFGGSPSGSLKRALDDMDLRDKEKVISLSDIFSIGPVWKLHDDVGLHQRYEWLENHLIFEHQELEEYKMNVRNTLLKIESILFLRIYLLSFGQEIILMNKRELDLLCTY